MVPLSSYCVLLIFIPSILKIILHLLAQKNKVLTTVALQRMKVFLPIMTGS